MIVVEGKNEHRKKRQGLDMGDLRSGTCRRNSRDGRQICKRLELENQNYLIVKVLGGRENWELRYHSLRTEVWMILGAEMECLAVEEETPQ